MQISCCRVVNGRQVLGLEVRFTRQDDLVAAMFRKILLVAAVNADGFCNL